MTSIRAWQCLGQRLLKELSAPLLSKFLEERIDLFRGRLSARNFVNHIALSSQLVKLDHHHLWLVLDFVNSLGNLLKEIDISSGFLQGIAHSLLNIICNIRLGLDLPQELVHLTLLLLNLRRQDSLLLNDILRFVSSVLLFQVVDAAHNCFKTAISLSPNLIQLPLSRLLLPNLTI